jgi:hypothetical protein
MSILISCEKVMDCVNQTQAISAILDMDEADKMSVGIHVSACSGSNLLDFEESTDGINFAQVCSLVITTTGTTIWHIWPVFSRWKRISYVPSTGSATFTVTVNVRNDGTQSTGDSPKIILS